VAVKWEFPAQVQLSLSGLAFRNSEIFKDDSPIERATVSADAKTATASIDTRQFADGPLTLTVHAWDSAPATAFSSESDAGTLSLAV
jgi:hypothetical protein